MFDLPGLLLVLAVVVLAFWQRKLRKRLDSHEREIERLSAELARLDLPRPVFAPFAAPGAMELTPAQASAGADSATLAEIAVAAPFEDGPTEAPMAPPQSPPIPPAMVQAQVAPPPPDRPVVLTPDLMERLSEFLRKNWVYVVSAVSLALAGLFLVQYGIERGLLTPPMRVGGALVLGAALVGWGEWLRRRGSDMVPYLPATFSGAGVVVIFAAILAARQLYGLIGPAPTLVGLVATGFVAIVLGWYHGALLIGLGLLGASAAPYLTGGEGEAPAWFYFYFALIASVGLAVDTVRRWAWVSALALVLAFLGGFAAHALGAGPAGWIALLAALPLLATILPERSLIPRQAGPSISELRLRALPPFPVRLVAGTLIASSGLTLFRLTEIGVSAGHDMLALASLAFLVLAFAIWASAAEGLADVALIPALAFVAFLVLAVMMRSTLATGFEDQAIALRAPETGPPMTVTLIMAMLAAMLAAAGWRSLLPGPLAWAQAAAAVTLAGLAAAILEFFWAPAEVMGAFPWALEVIGLAAVTVVLALAFARRDGADHHRTATAALIALSLIALALSILTAGTPLTLALSVLLVAAAALDRRFDLPEMTVFLQIGVAVLTWRIVVDPGAALATYLPLGDFVTTFLGPIAAGVASLWLLRPMDRVTARAVVESGTLLWIVGFLDALLLRWLDGGASDWVPGYLGASLMALPWIGAMYTQAYRAARILSLRRLRQVLAVISGVLGLGLLALSAVPLNPLAPYADRIIGPPVFSSLALAYLVPGLSILAASLWLPGLPRRVRQGGLAIGTALAVLYLGLEIRRFWWGDDVRAVLGVRQEELYTYTIAMMLIGAGLLAAALTRHSALLRRVAMAVIALTIAKVFLLDAAGLTGLTRVLSFLGLGLSLAGLAWLNGVVERAARAAAPVATEASSDPAVPPSAPEDP